MELMFNGVGIGNILIVTVIIYYLLRCVWFFAGRYFERKKKIRDWLNHEERNFRYQKGYPNDWYMRRLCILDRDNFTCSKCNKCYKNYNHHLHVHHIKPISKGGNHHLDNLMLLCESCHINEHPFWKSKQIKERIRYIEFNYSSAKKETKKMYEEELKVLERNLETPQY